jgi:hypothetical protein
MQDIDYSGDLKKKKKIRKSTRAIRATQRSAIAGSHHQLRAEERSGEMGSQN